MKYIAPETVHGMLEAAQSAGRIIRSHWGERKHIRYKGRIDLVTKTDLAVEEHLKSRLAEVLPEATIMAEESAQSHEPGNLCWIVDPLDGTTNYAHGFPFVATSIALWHEGRVVLGAVNAPMLGELFHAVAGQGAWLNGEPISVSREADLGKALVATGFPYGIGDYVERILDKLGKVLVATQGVRRPGAAAIDLAYTACGRYDGFYEYDLKPWDTAAGMLLVEEAGGRVSRFEPIAPYRPGDETILASNASLHEALGRLLAGEEES